MQYRIASMEFETNAPTWDYWVERFHSTKGWRIIAVCPNLFTAEKILAQLEA